MGSLDDEANAMSQLPETGLLRLPQVLAVIPVSKSTWWHWVAEGRAPAGVKLGRCTAWRAESIRDFLNALGTEPEDLS